MFCSSRSQVFDASRGGPRQALKRLCSFNTEKDRASWIANAKLQAILGSCPKSHASVLSGIRCYIAFAEKVLKIEGEVFPPSREGLLAWSISFRCHGTFCNYLSYVQTACELLDVPTEVFSCRALKRAKVAITKRDQFVSRCSMFLRLPMVRSLMRLAVSDGCKRDAMLYLVSYVFLLRVPSEALPMVMCNGGAVHGEQSCLFMEDGKLVLALKCRKNKPKGSKLVRSCWCAQDTTTCPVHVLGKALSRLPVGFAPFKGLKPSMVVTALRDRLRRIGVEQADHYRTQDFRRGHARDLQANGSHLRDILNAGEWRSPAFLSYLDVAQLEQDVVVEAHLAESSDEES